MVKPNDLILYGHYLESLYALGDAECLIEEIEDSLKMHKKSRARIKLHVKKVREQYKSLNGVYPKMGKKDKYSPVDPFDA